VDPQKLQKQMMDALAQAQELQEQAAQETVEASAGGGTVTVKANGAGEITEITIKPEAIDPDDPELLADLVLAAVNEALRSAQKLMESKMGGLMGGLGGLGLPGM
jgi:DNA-binding YbaB/EbfC family protein